MSGARISQIIKIRERKLEASEGFDWELFYSYYWKKLEDAVSVLLQDTTTTVQLNPVEPPGVSALVDFCRLMRGSKHDQDQKGEGDKIEALLISADAEMMSSQKSSIKKCALSLRPLVNILKKPSVTEADSISVTMFDAQRRTAINNIVLALSGPEEFITTCQSQERTSTPIIITTRPAIDAKTCRDIVKSYTTSATWPNYFGCFFEPERYRSSTIKALRDMVGEKISLMSVGEMDENALEERVKNKKGPMIIQTNARATCYQQKTYHVCSYIDGQFKSQQLRSDSSLDDFFSKYVKSYAQVVDAHTADKGFPDSVIEQLQKSGLHKQNTQVTSEEIDNAINTESYFSFSRYRRQKLFSGKKTIKAGEKPGNDTDRVVDELRKLTTREAK